MTLLKNLSMLKIEEHALKKVKLSILLTWCWRLDRPNFLRADASRTSEYNLDT